MLSSREILILNMITEMFIMHGEPIGSRTLEKNSDIGLSSATIRNVMSDLENLGYLVKMHSSSGRKPSHQGLLYYSNEILKNINDKRRSSINDLKLESYRLDKILNEAGKFLKTLTNYASLTFIPKEEDASIVDLFLKKIAADRALFVITTDDDRVFSSVLEDINLNSDEILKINNFLNKTFKKSTLKNFKSNLKVKFIKDFYFEKLTIDRILNVLESDEYDQELHLEGLNKLLDHPDFKELDDIKTIANIMEDDSFIIEKLKAVKDGFHILIDDEDEKPLGNLALITSTYNYEDEKKAVLGILAPIRIDYQQALKSLIEVDKRLKKLMEDNF